jgi:tRNA 2-thiouridine synthesizing protein C
VVAASEVPRPRPQYCLHIRSAPYGTSGPAEAFRVVQTMFAFDHAVTVLFSDEGVLSLVRGADPAPIGMKPLSEAFSELGGLWGVDIAVHLESLEERGLRVDDLVPHQEDAPPYRLVRTSELEAVLASHKAILRF